MFFHLITKVFFICFCGFLLSLSAPGYDLWILAWVGLSPLFIIINTSKGMKEAGLYSFLFGFAYNFWYLHWLFSLHPLSWLGFSNFVSIVISVLALVIVTFYNSLFFVLFGVLAAYLRKISIKPYSQGLTYILIVTFLWLVIFNKLSSLEFLLGFPWTLIEYSQYKNLFLIQLSEYFGGMGVAFLIMFFNLIFAELLIWLFGIEKISGKLIPREPGQLGVILGGFGFVLALICISLVCGVFLYEKNAQGFASSEQNLSVLQGNLPLKVTRGSKIDINFAKNTYNKLVENNNARLIIFPEGALPTVFNSDSTTQSWFKNLAKGKNLDILSGSYCKQNHLLTNCAVSYSSLNNQFLYYEKEILVPFGEFTPFSFILPGFLKRLASNVIGEGFAAGKQNAPLYTKLGNAGINICFELIFPAIIRRHTLQKADFLVNISDLSWFSNSLIKKQFLSFAVFRAIENRKWLIVASNNGISAFVEPSGRIKSQSQENAQGVLFDRIIPNNKITYYAKYGW